MGLTLRDLYEKGQILILVKRFLKSKLWMLRNVWFVVTVMGVIGFGGGVMLIGLVIVLIDAGMEVRGLDSREWYGGDGSARTIDGI